MDLFAATQPLRARAWVGYLVAVLAPLGGLAVRVALGDALNGYPFLTFFPAVAAAAFLGGWGAGLVATAVSAALSSYFLIAPFGFLIAPLGTLAVAWPDGWIALSFFSLVSGAFVGLIEVTNRAMNRLAAVSIRLRGINRHLEARVRRRTRELQAANARLHTEIATREVAEAQFRQVQKMEAVGQLTGGVAHDFNNMLAIVIGSLDIARRRLAGGRADVIPLIDNALEGANRGATLTQRLLAFSRRQALAPVVVDLNDLVRGMEDLIRRSIGETIDVECVLAGGLWPTRVDPGQLESAILNLAVNARDAMPQGGRLTIETMNARLDEAYAATHADAAPGQYVVVAVTDSGAGMPAEVAVRAFDPFYTTKPLGRGTGLGLSQVHGFIRQSGGHVKIYSEEGHGTVVKLYLRRASGDAPAAGTQGRSSATPNVPRGGAHETVLVVEDEDGVRRSTVAALRELGYAVRHTGSPLEALAILEKEPGIDLLLTDVVMPEMTGRKLADAVAERRPGLKVLYTTGYTQNAIVHNGMLDVGVEMLPKPFALDQLARKVRSVLDGGRVR